MGVRGLLTFCKRIQKKANMEVTDLHIGVDGFSLIYLFKERRDDFAEYMRGLVACSSTKGSIEFIMDRRASKEKMEVVKERREIRNEAKAEAKSLSTFVKSSEFDELDEKCRAVLEKVIAEKERAAWHLYPEYLKWLLEMLKNKSVNVTWAEEEADTALASDIYDVVVSSDSDMLILGVKRMWLPRGVGLEHNEISSEDFLRCVGLEGDQMYELAYLAGCDVHSKSLMSVGEAVSRLRFYGSIENIHKKHPNLVSSEEVLEYNKLRVSVWGSASNGGDGRLRSKSL